MGYTHYWDLTPRHKHGPTWDMLITISEHIVRLAEGKSTETAGGYYSEHKLMLDRIDDKVEVNRKVIRFNGIGDLAHETFYLPRPDNKEKNVWDFCKTARKSYDVCVVAVLEAARRMDILTWSSDGGEDDHIQGIELCDEAFSLEPWTIQFPCAAFLTPA